eukprot:m.203644 g.203644  ORF g.203644 m.203644 type:complete len:93 (-) comp25279_c0_seq3:127-405(-)
MSTTRHIQDFYKIEKEPRYQLEEGYEVLTTEMDCVHLHCAVSFPTKPRTSLQLEEREIELHRVYQRYRESWSVGREQLQSVSSEWKLVLLDH